MLGGLLRVGEEFPLESADVFMISAFFDETGIPAGVLRSYSGFYYPDAYKLVTLSVFWQHPWVYVAGADNGVYVVDASGIVLDASHGTASLFDESVVGTPISQHLPEATASER